MKGVAWKEVADLFADLVELDHSERRAALERRTAERPSTREAVERLLRAHDAATDDFLSELDPGFAQAVLNEAGSEPRSTGPYRLVRRIGSGGMGHVYEAQRDDGHFDRRVAVKILKRGMDTDLIYQRFLRERQILAGFEHPCIARLTDGGITDDGRPYIVMEYVDGVPIDDFCDQEGLTVDGRVDLIRTVCSAVAHAHRSLVVHRDLKPSNILVTGDGTPKLLDFGIAKILREPDGAGATATAHVRLLTPEYAAPEQAMGLAVTTATDVHGLGIVLLELLTGCRPPAAVFPRVSEDPRDILAGGTPLRPGKIYDRVDPARQLEIAADRATDPDRLRRRLDGDLGTIVTKALEPDPARRYASVDALHDDLVRYRQQKPILARPLTVRYRLGQFLRRNRMAASAAAAAGILTAAFVVTATSQSLR
ncbi:MAG: serine/threonine protein kinase, partial [Gemmatimonadetes bacterium]|nr:serine/threonine protein kinase [Gemmatimonadota bacterium]